MRLALDNKDGVGCEQLILKYAVTVRQAPELAHW